MRLYVLPTLFKLALLCSCSVTFAQQSTDEIPVDKQVDLNLPQKADPRTKKKPAPKPLPEKKETTTAQKKVSYDGLWLVNRISDNCKSRIIDFKIRITGQDISTVIGMNVKGRVFNGDNFEMNAKSQYWVIKFSGQLKQKTGFGKMSKIDTSNATCSGEVGLTRIGN